MCVCVELECGYLRCVHVSECEYVLSVHLCAVCVQTCACSCDVL